MNALLPRVAAALCTLGLLLPTTTSASHPSVSASVSAETVQVVEPFTFTLRVQAEQGAKVAFPDMPNKLDHFDIRDVQDVFDVPAVNDASLRMWTRRYTLESIETGDLDIPPLNLQVSRAGETVQLTTQPIAIRVLSVLEDRRDPTQFRDIQSVVDVDLPEPQAKRFVPWTAIVAVSLIGLALLMGMAVYRRRGVVTPAAWAVRQIDALDSDSPNVPDQLSQILREFLKLQFEMSDTSALGSGRSAQEVVQCLLEQRRIPASFGLRLRGLFDLTDQAKFAGLRLSPQEARTAIAEVRDLVDELASTGPKPS